MDTRLKTSRSRRLPGFYCTGNLYRPEHSRVRPVPASCAHTAISNRSDDFEPDQQIRCAQLARMGATVYSYSMVGWQDSQQTTTTIQCAGTADLEQHQSTRFPFVARRRRSPADRHDGSLRRRDADALSRTPRRSRPRIRLPWSFFIPGPHRRAAVAAKEGFPSCRRRTRTASSLRRRSHSPAIDHFGRPGPDVRFSESRFSFYSSGLRGIQRREPSRKCPFGQREARLGPSKRAAMYRFFARQLG